MENRNVETGTIKVIVKEDLDSTQEHLVDLFDTLLDKFEMNNIMQQYAYCHELKRNLANDGSLIHVDFSENFLCR